MEPLTTSSDLTTQVEAVLQVTKVIPLHTHNGTDSLQIMQTNVQNDTTVAASGSPALTGNVILAGGTNITVTQSGQTITITGSQTGVALADLFGDGSDGAVTISSPITLTRDMYYSSLTINTGQTLTTAGYQIFCTGTITINGTGNISYNGNGGTAGTAGTSSTNGLGGAGGIALTGGTLPGALAGIVGGAGGVANANGGGGNSPSPSNGVSTNPSIGANGAVGATGGSGGNANAFSGGGTASGGTGGTATLALNPPHTLNGAYIHADLVATYIQHLGSASNGGSSGGGGAAGAVGNPGGGGGAGGGGSCGGVIAIYANIIVNNSTAGIEAIGGTGGAGGAGGNASGGGVGGGGGGGAGGRGGTGGVLILVYHTLTQSGSFSVAGGTGGNGGGGGTHTGGASGSDGSAGNNAGDGSPGVIWQLIV